MVRTKQILCGILLSLTLNTVFSCGAKDLTVLIKSSTLDIKELSKKDTTFYYSIYNKDTRLQGRLPDKLNYVKLNNKELHDNEYTYSPDSGNFSIPASEGELVISAELISTYSITLDSSSIEQSARFVDVNKDLDISLSPIDKINTFLPDNLSSIKVGESELSSSQYIYNNKTGSLHIDKEYVLGNVVIAGETLKKSNYAYKVSFVCSDNHASFSLYNKKDYSEEPIKGSVAYSVDGDTGDLLKDGNGQVNFKINVDDGYDVDMILVRGLYKNCKGKDDTELDDVYRITKIESDLVVEITTYPIYIKDFVCIGDTTNHRFHFSWSLRNQSLFEYTKIKIVTSDSIVELNVEENEYTLENVEYGKLYSLTFTPISSTIEHRLSKYVSKLMLDPELSISMPKLKIETSNGVWPTCNQHGALTKGMHEGKDPYVKANVEMLDESNKKIFSSYSNANNSKIKTRGNTSARGTNKKPYKIKLDEPVDLLENYRKVKKEGVNYTHTEWNLIPYTDLMSDLVGFATSRTLEFEYAHEFTYLLVYINNDYQGLYALTETNDAGLGEGEQQGRYKISDDGFLIENDYFYRYEEVSFDTTFAKKYRYTFKHPDIYDKGMDYVSKTQSYIKQIEILLSNKDTAVFDYIDIETFAKWIVSFDIIGQDDQFGANRFLYRYDDNSILKMGTPWDFSRLYSSVIVTKGVKTDTNFFFYYLLKFTEFNSEIRTVFDKYKDKFLTNIEQEISSINETGFNDSIELEKIKYSTYYNYSETLSYIQNYITNRIALLEDYY